jgi:hypothetical protein
MRTKEYLMQYKILCGEIERDRERIEQIESSLNKSLELDGMPRGTKTGDPTSQTAIRLAEIRSRLHQRLLEAELTRQTIADEIERMETPAYRELIFSRYILLLKWEEVTDRVSRGRRERYELKHIMGYMHGQALKEFEEVHDERTDHIESKHIHQI